MKNLLLLLVLVVAMSSCHKKEKEAAMKAKEEALQEKVYEENLASLGSTETSWITWYLKNYGRKPGSLYVYHLKKGQMLDYTFQDTIREGNLKKDLYAPRIMPGNAFIVNGEKSKIDSCDAPIKHLVVFEGFPNPAPVELVLSLSKLNSGILTGGYIIAQDIGQWFFFDIPGTFDELYYYSDPGDFFLIADDKLPAFKALVYDYKGAKNDGSGKVKQTGKYLIGKDGSMTKY